MQSGTYCRVQSHQTNIPALAMEMVHVMEPCKMKYAHVEPSQMNGPALPMATEPYMRKYFRVASSAVDDPVCTMETAHATVLDMEYSHGT